MADEKIIFSMTGVNKIYPPQKQVLKNIYLSFFYGAKIGVLGLNGSGKSSLLRIIAGIDKEFQGEVVSDLGYSVGYLEQEPQLDKTKTVKEIVLLTAAKGILAQDLNSYQLEAAQLWTSSLLVAELSSKIVQHKKLKIDKDLAFTSGLLCSVGKIVLAQFFSPVMMQIKTDLKDNQEPFPTLEKKYFGYTHMEVSENLLKRWNFPPELTDVVANYLTPETSKVNPLLTSVVHLASILIVVSGIGIDIGGESVPISPFALSQTGVTDADIETYFVHIPDLQAGLADLLNV